MQFDTVGKFEQMINLQRLLNFKQSSSPRYNAARCHPSPIRRKLAFLPGNINTPLPPTSFISALLQSRAVVKVEGEGVTDQISILGMNPVNYS